MHLLWRRWSRSGSAAPWFSYAMAVAFVALAIGAAAQGAWLVFALALAMAPTALAGSRAMRRIAGAARASDEHIAAITREAHDER